MLKVRHENNSTQFKGYDTYTWGTKTKNITLPNKMVHV